MATCPFCHRGSLRIIAAITQESVITRILRHLKLASVPPPIAPARLRQEIFAFDDAHATVSPEVRCAPQRCLSPLFALQSRPPSASSNRWSRDLRTGKPISSQRNPSCPACPERAKPCPALLRVAFAGRRRVLGEPPARRVGHGRRRRARRCPRDVFRVALRKGRR
jgi:hypothetical protein